MKLFLMIATVIATQAHAETADELLHYVHYAAKEMGFEYQGQPLPRLKQTKHDMVQIIAYGDLKVAQAEYKGLKLPTVNSVYESATKTVYISDRLMPGTPLRRLALVHEMVHYIQDISGYTASLGRYTVCTESEAYDIQMLYQREFHLMEETIPNVYQTSVLAAMQCMGNQSAAFKSRMDPSIPQL